MKKNIIIISIVINVLLIVTVAVGIIYFRSTTLQRTDLSSHAGDSSIRYYVGQTLETSADWQKSLLNQYIEANDDASRTRLAFSLSRLWFKGALDDRAKDYLVEHFYHIRLIQYSDKPELHLWLWGDESFPFPRTKVWLTVTRYHNGLPSVPSSAVSASLADNNLSINYAYIPRGQAKNGDSFYYEVQFREKNGGETIWEKKLRSNEILVQGLQ